jgi:hypothetical protein
MGFVFRLEMVCILVWTPGIIVTKFIEDLFEITNGLFGGFHETPKIPIRVSFKGVKDHFHD